MNLPTLQNLEYLRIYLLCRILNIYESTYSPQNPTFEVRRILNIWWIYLIGMNLEYLWIYLLRRILNIYESTYSAESWISKNIPTLQNLEYLWIYLLCRILNIYESTYSAESWISKNLPTLLTLVPLHHTNVWELYILYSRTIYYWPNPFTNIKRIDSIPLSCCPN